MQFNSEADANSALGNNTFETNESAVNLFWNQRIPPPPPPTQENFPPAPLLTTSTVLK